MSDSLSSIFGCYKDIRCFIATRVDKKNNTYLPGGAFYISLAKFAVRVALDHMYHKQELKQSTGWSEVCCKEDVYKNLLKNFTTNMHTYVNVDMDGHLAVDILPDARHFIRNSGLVNHRDITLEVNKRG